MSKNEYVPVDPSHSELLNYHLKVTGNVDAEVERRKAIDVLHRLNNPPVHQIHQHALISHDAQKTPVNENNLLLEKRNKQLAKEVEDEKQEAREVKENPNYKHLSPEEVAVSTKDMEEQVKAAANRTSDRPTWQPNVEPEKVAVPAKVAEPAKPVHTASKGKTKAAGAVPTWKR